MNKIFRVVWNQATQSWVAVSELTKAHKKQSSSNSLKAVVGTAAVLLSINTAQAAVAIGETTANNTFTQSSAQATGNNAVAIGQNSKATKDDTIALGTNSKSTNTYTVALGRNTEAAGQRSMAFGNEAKATANDTIAFGSSSEAKKNNDIIIGKEAKSRDEGGGHSIAIGYNSTAGSTKVGAATDVTSTNTNAAAGGVAIGVSSYTGVNRNNAAINSSVAIGAGAGAGFRAINADGIPTGNGTDPDDNATVLSKAFGNTPTEAGNKDEANRFNYKGVDINEGTAVGRNTRAIGDQAVALGAQSIAGQGAIAIGGNDITQFANARYFMSNKDNFGVAEVSDHDQSGTLASKTISQKYQELVGAALNTAYQATYAQNGSTVIGMQAHSTTPLGVAIGTNALVRKGAYGATAIGSGSAIQANAEAAVAIGMGSWVNGKFGVAAGTASRAEQSAVAAGYKANADKSAVAVGDSSKATNSSVAVGQLAQATKEADIAVGQGAKASGNQGAIAMGLGTNAQGDSSIMIGGSDISSAANQRTEFEKATGGITAKSVTEKINGKDVTRNYTFAETTTTPGTIAEAYKELTGLDMDVSTLDFADAKNKNGHASTSLGVHALSKGNLATAIGAGARADAIGSLALGTGAHATKQNAVAIGTGSTTALVGTRQLSVNYDSDGNIVSDNDKDKIAYTFKWAGGTNTSEGDVVSFGSSGAERQLKNVAAGRVAEDSTDAINGSQLNSITKKIAAGFNTSGNEVAGSSGVFTSKKANADSAKKDYETAIRSDDKVQLQVGNNLKLDRDETVSEVDVPDDFDKTKTVKKKIRKADFAYSLNPVLTNLTSAEFIGTGTDKPTTKLTNDGVTITPATSTGKKPVSLTENGLDNGGNPITNVAGNLDGAKTGTTAPTTKADKPNNVDDIKNNAATVGDVLNAGWNLKENTTAKDFVTAYDTVSFVNGDGTTVSVENTDGKTSTIKYSANLGDGLKKDDATNKITVNAADKSLTVGSDGVKVNTGNINTAAVPTVTAGDENKIATVGNVVDAIKAAAWKATSAATSNGENTGTTVHPVKAGDTVTFEADKNIKIAQVDGKFTFSTKDNVEFTTVKVSDTANGKKPVELKSGDVINANNNPEQPATALNVSSDGKPTQITGVGSVLNTEAVPTTPAGTATTGNDQPKLVNLGTGHNQPALGNNILNAAATVRDLASMGWVVSSDKTTDAAGEYKDVVKNANEVKFVGKNAAKVSGKTENGVRTITVDVTVPETKTAELVSSKDGSVIAPSTDSKLQEALKAAKDELATAATPEQKKAAENKVKDAETALNKAVDDKGVATAKNVADMINASGFTLKTSNVDGGEKVSGDDEVINPGKAVEMVAGKNLTVKQEANGKVTYSTKDEVEFTSVKVGDTQNGKAPVNFTTEAAKPASNNGTDKTPTTALNISSSDGKPTQLKGVGSVLNTEAQPTSTGKQGDTPATAGNQNLVNLGNDPKAGNKSSLAPEILNSAATVGDLANMGWVVSTKDGNGYTDVVKNANQVDFVGKNGITVTGKTGTDGVRTITVEAAQTPVVYTNKAGDKLVKVGDKFYKADEVENGKPKENAQVVPNDKVIASMNNGGNNATNNPMHLSNIGSNLPTVNDTTKQAFDPNSTAPKADKNNKSAPITAAEAAELLDPNSNKFAGNNAATVSDVLNAGWNLQNNDEARDFVKPYDTVNFVDGINTKAVVTTDAEGKVSNVQIDVKDLPIAYTNEAGDKVVKAADGKYYKESDLAGKVYDPKTKQFKNADGTALANQPTEVAGNTVKTNLVNPNAEANKAGNATQLGNVASGANTFAPVDGKKMANDGKWYPADQVEPNGQPKKDASPVAVPNNIGKAGLIDFSKSNPNNAATVGDLQNLGWVVSAKGNDYSDQVRNANEVKFVGEGTASVTGKTDENGVRTITVKVDDQVSTNNAQVPVNYTTADGTKVYPVKDEKGNVTYHTTPDGKGQGDTEIPKGNVITSINGPEGTTAPTTLSNVAGNLDGAKKDTKAPTTEHGPVNTTDKNAVNYVNPNNAATVGDVLNAGWNLQNNGDARDFVKPYDTVNFVDGINTKAVVTTDAEGKVSNVQIDVKDLPIAYTNEAGDKVVKAADGKYYKESDLAGKVYDPKTKQFKNADGTALANQPTEVAGNTVKTNLVNPNAEANKAGNATQLGNVASGANTFAPVDGKKMANDGKWYPADQVEPNGQPKKDASPVAVPNNIGKAGLIDFSKSNPNNAATVGDLQNLGWVVSAKGNDYSDQVRNANEVKFVGEGTASVTGKTDENGVRTITVKVDDQVSTNNAQVPVNYTTADGTKVYPVKDEKGNVTYHTTPDGKGQGDTEIPKGNVITSINGPEGTTAPTTLSNVAGNLDGAKKDTKAPTTEHGPVNTTDKNAVNYVNPNNAATVGDVLNAGWNLQNNGDARDFVKPYDTVNFINGKGTVAVVETAGDATSSTVKFDVDAGEITADENKPGAVKGPNTTGKTPTELAKNLADAQKAVDDLAKDPSATKDAKQKAQDALKAAQDAAAPLNKVATAQNVADMINKSGFTLKADKTEGDNLTAADLAKGEMINPGDTITMKAGKNMSVKHEKDGSITYATKDDVSFNTVNVGGDNTYVDENGKPVTKKEDGTYVDENGQPVEEGKVTKLAPVAMKAEKAKPASNNGTDKTPTTALNVSSTDGKPTQITGVGSTLNVNPVNTNPNGTATTGDARPNLVDLVGTDTAPVNKNAAATVGDLQNMGWVVGAPENGYVDTVKNANKVDFKGENGISVTGKTNDKGVREITISVAEGKVTNDVKVTKADGTVIDGVKGPDGKLYKKGPDGKPDTSKEITLAEGDKVNNEGSKFVSGNAVATAIQESGWNVGLADSSKANEAFNDDSKALSANKLEKVNPNDNVRFADGKGTKAAVATVESVDEFGKKVTDTYVKFDVDAGEITADTTKPGMVKGPVTADEAKKLADDLKKAEQAVKDLPADATPEAKKAAQDALKVAQDAAAPLNKVATAQNVAEAINNSGWRTNSTTATGGAKDTLINPGKAVNFESGKNMEVAQTVDKDGNVAYTYKTKDDVQFNSVQFGDANGPKITNNDGNINVSGADGKAPTKITGVAAGDISPNSTDAVNGAQVYALSRGNVPNVKNITVDGKEYKNVIVDENGTPILKTYNVQGQKEIITNSVVEAIHNMNEQGIKFFHSNDGIERPKQEQTNSFDSSASGKFATAIGSKSSAEGTNAVAIGFNSVVTGNDSISIGTGNRVTGNNSGAFGDPSTVSGQGSYSVGNNNTVATNDTFVLGNKVTQTVENSVILGTKSTATAGDGSATGTLNNIKQDGTKGTSTTAGSKGTVKQAIVGNMVYGGFEGATADGVVSVGAAGNERRIQNVAAGEISATSTDAINGSQLYSVAQGVGNRLGDLNNKINRNNKNLRAGIAGANAAAGLPQVYIPGKSMVAASAGTYKGQSALAVGYSRASDNGKLILKLQGNANTRGDVGGSVGVGYQW